MSKEINLYILHKHTHHIHKTGSFNNEGQVLVAVQNSTKHEDWLLWGFSLLYLIITNGATQQKNIISQRNTKFCLVVISVFMQSYKLKFWLFTDKTLTFKHLHNKCHP